MSIKNITNKLLMVSAVFYTAIIFADNEALDIPLTELRPEQKKLLEQQGYIAESGGINLIPRNKSVTTTEEQKEYDHKHTEFLQKGYNEEESNMAIEYLRLKEHIRVKFSLSPPKDNEQNTTDMKLTPEQVGVGYDFKPVPQDEVDDLIGYAAMGSYIDNIGWDGIGEFFDKKNIGTCCYTEENTKLSFASIQADEDKVTYDINNKVTTISIKGSEASGYLYSIHWYSKDFFRSLQCANKQYAKAITDSVIALANKIDMQ